MGWAPALLAVLELVACDGASRRGDTIGVQTLGRWEWHGRLVVLPDPRLTLVRMRIDTSSRDSGDVVLARFDVDPTPGVGDEYALTIGLELGRIRDLRPGVAYPIGTAPARIPAFATITCLCEPLRPDSIRGTFLLVTRGLRHLTGRIDAALYFTAWNRPARHAAYFLHQRLDAIK